MRRFLPTVAALTSIVLGSLVLAAAVPANPPAAPVALAPGGGATTASFDLAWTWSDADPASWRVELDGAPVAAGLAPDKRRYHVVGPIAPGAHDWRVVAVAADTTETTSTVVQFVVDTTPPAAPTSVVPDGSARVTARRPTFQWWGASDAASGIARYDVFVDGQLAATVAGDQAAAASTIDIPDGIHRWHVVVVDRAGNETSTSTRLVVVDTQRLAVALLPDSPRPVPAGQRVSLDASVLPESGDGAPYSYEWDLDGDGVFDANTGSVSSVSRSYPTARQFTASVRVTDSRGQSVVAQAPITIVDRTAGPTFVSAGPLLDTATDIRRLARGSQSARITFSPDGDHRNESLQVKVATTHPSLLVMDAYVWGGKVSGWRRIYTSKIAKVAAKARYVFQWNARPGQRARPVRDGSYLVDVCSLDRVDARHAHALHAREVADASHQAASYATATVEPEGESYQLVRPVIAVPSRGAVRLRPSLRAAAPAVRHCLRAPVAVHVRRLEAWLPQPRSVAPGETVQMALATDKASVTVSLTRDGDASGAVLATQQLTAATIVDVPLPATLQGGLYHLRVADTTGNVRTIPLVVRDGAHSMQAPTAGTALVVWPYVTWQAYNGVDADRNGVPDSWYQDWSNATVPLASSTEPGGDVHDAEQAHAFARWLDGMGPSVHVQHVLDTEVAHMAPADLAKYSAIVFPGHTEYYQQDLYDALMGYRASGGDLVFLSANNFYRRVSIDPATNTVTLLDSLARDGSTSDFAMSGVGYAAAGVAPGVPYEVTAQAQASTPWLFANTGLRPGDWFGIASTEVDRTDAVLSPPSLVRVATATVPEATNTVETSMAYAQLPGTAEVFSTGNFDFMRNADIAGTMLRNVWKRMVVDG